LKEIIFDGVEWRNFILQLV